MNVPTKAELRAEIHELYEMLNASNQTIDDLLKDKEILLTGIRKAVIGLSHAAMNNPNLYQDYYISASDAIDAAMQERQP